MPLRADDRVAVLHDLSPATVPKLRRRLDGIDEIVLSRTARGLTTTGGLGAHFDQVYGAKVSTDTIPRITDKVIEDLAEWQDRPLDPVNPVVLVDVVPVRARRRRAGAPASAVSTAPRATAATVPGLATLPERDAVTTSKVRDGQDTNRAFDVVIGVTVEGRRDILATWAGTAVRARRTGWPCSPRSRIGHLRRVHRALGQPRRVWAITTV